MPNGIDAVGVVRDRFEYSSSSEGVSIQTGIRGEARIAFESLEARQAPSTLENPPRNGARCVNARSRGVLDAD